MILYRRGFMKWVWLDAEPGSYFWKAVFWTRCGALRAALRHGVKMK